ncbi:MAG: AGE family epimerase/isomerase [Bacteroidales bacterium]|nr:AGE family epimerase/isomerase [Bacteroidales bacterium]
MSRISKFDIMDSPQIQRLVRETADVLEHNILDYWLTLRDPRGGFFGEVMSSGEIVSDAPRGVILNARIIWAFAAAYEMFPKKAYRQAAEDAGEWFLAHFLDKEAGGVYWSVLAGGERLDDKKQLYAQGFAIYGLSELYKATREAKVLDAATELFRLIEDRFADRLHGGYIEALARDFSPLEDMSLSAHDINADKTMNSHLHLMEAYANLYKVWPDPRLKEALVKLIELTCTHIIGADGHLQLYFRKDWSVLPGAVSFGHDIETSWLLLECARCVGDSALVSRVEPFAAALGHAGNEGLLADGSMRYEIVVDGSADDSRQWWVQAETVVGNLWLWKFHGDEAGLGRALACWAFIRDRLVDNEGGDWYWAILADGKVDLSQPKAGFWKCPYHNTRMCLEIQKLFTE